MLRRAERYGRQYLSTKAPFLHLLVPIVVDTMKSAFPELVERIGPVTKLILEEEDSFLRTLDRGLKLFSEVAEKQSRKVGKPFREPMPLISTPLMGSFPTSPPKWRGKRVCLLT